MEQCVCGSLLPADLCCLQYITGEKKAPTAEALMRSRYTAFYRRDAQYLFDTYASEWQEGKDVEDIAKHFGPVTWIELEIIGIFQGGRQHDTGEVEFVAHYELDGHPFTLHERSEFQREQGEWRYVRAKI